MFILAVVSLVCSLTAKSSAVKATEGCMYQVWKFISTMTNSMKCVLTFKKFDVIALLNSDVPLLV